MTPFQYDDEKAHVTTREFADKRADKMDTVFEIPSRVERRKAGAIADGEEAS